MSIMKKILFVLILSSLLAQNRGAAQNRYDWHQKKYTVTVQPLQLLRNSLRLDFEMRIANSPSWLQFGPALYYAKGENNHLYMGGRNERDHYDFAFIEPFIKLSGGGLDVNYKWFFNEKRSTYFLSGLSLTRFNIKYWGTEWCDYIEDGLPYSWYQPVGELNQQITRPGVNFLFGFQIPARHAFLFDMFGGFSYRYSITDKNKPSFGETAFSYGYTGWVFVTGIRIGIGTK